MLNNGGSYSSHFPAQTTQFSSVKHHCVLKDQGNIWSKTTLTHTVVCKNLEPPLIFAYFAKKLGNTCSKLLKHSQCCTSLLNSSILIDNHFKFGYITDFTSSSCVIWHNSAFSPSSLTSCVRYSLGFFLFLFSLLLSDTVHLLLRPATSFLSFSCLIFFYVFEGHTVQHASF